MLQAQVAYENQKPSVLRMEQTLQHNLDTFAFLLGMPAGTKIALKGSIATEFYALNADELIANNLNSRLDLRVLNKSTEALKIQLSALNLSTYTPSLALSYNYQPIAALTSLKDGVDDPWTDNGSLSITLAWNLTNMLPFSASRQQAKDLKANIEKLKISSEMLVSQAKNEINSLIDSLELSRSSIEASEQSVTLAQTAYSMTEASYRNGTSELLDLRDAENSFNQAKLGLLNEKFNYLSGLLDLEYSVNTKLTTLGKK
jgi:outer membrane protein TolC